MSRLISKWWEEVDKVNFLVIFVIAIIGVILSFSIDRNFTFFNKHLFYSTLGMILMIAISSMDIKLLRR